MYPEFLASELGHGGQSASGQQRANLGQARLCVSGRGSHLPNWGCRPCEVLASRGIPRAQAQVADTRSQVYGIEYESKGLKTSSATN